MPARVQWTTGGVAVFEPFMQRSAVGETVAHLEYLVEMGRLVKHEPDHERGLITWTRA